MRHCLQVAIGQHLIIHTHNATCGLYGITFVPVTGGLPLTGKTSQSSEGWSGRPSRAVDGITNQNYNHNSCTHTGHPAKTKEWWKLDFGSSKKVSKVEVWNRADCCSNRLNGVEVKVGDSVCGKLTGKTTMQVVTCNKEGSSVTLLMPRRNYLSLCEVKVYGSGKGSASGGRQGKLKKGTAGEETLKCREHASTYAGPAGIHTETSLICPQPARPTWHGQQLWRPWMAGDVGSLAWPTVLVARHGRRSWQLGIADAFGSCSMADSVGSLAWSTALAAHPAPRDPKL